MKAFWQLLRTLRHHHYMIQTMALREIKARYVGSVMGVFWSVLHPMLMVFVYWFIFSVGFKVQPAGEIPFVIWFFCGFIPWTTFSELINFTTPSVITNTSLVKRTLFPSQILPFIYWFSSGINHLIMILILWGMMLVGGLDFSWYHFQFLYYWLMFSVMGIGLGWLFAALNVFLRDVGQLVGVILQVWFWATPIFWHLEMLPQSYQTILRLNPMLIAVTGYRNSFLYHRPFWEDGWLGLYGWGLALACFGIGGWVFRRLKPSFADVL